MVSQAICGLKINHSSGYDNYQKILLWWIDKLSMTASTEQGGLNIAYCSNKVVCAKQYSLQSDWFLQINHLVQLVGDGLAQLHFQNKAFNELSSGGFKKHIAGFYKYCMFYNCLEGSFIHVCHYVFFTPPLAGTKIRIYKKKWHSYNPSLVSDVWLWFYIKEKHFI